MGLRPWSLLCCSLLLLQTACLSQAGDTDQWKVFPLGDPPLKIKLPGEVTPMEASVPSDMINRLQRFDTYRFYHAEGKLVAVFKFIQYNTTIEETTSELLEKEVATTMTMIKAEQMEQTGKDIKWKKVPGRHSTGSFLLDNQKWLFQDILLRNDSSMWQVWVAAEDTDPALITKMNQIVKGIKF